MNTLRILVVDDHEAVRRGLRSLLSSRKDWQICAEAADGLEAVERARARRPDVVLMDISMPRMNGLEATRVIRRELPEIQVVIISQNDPSVARRQAEDVGAAGFVSKSSMAQELPPMLDRMSGSSAATKEAPRMNASPRASSTPVWLSGGGTLGQLIREYDWARTPLGPLENWPQSLKTSVNLMVNSRHPMWIGWGPEITFLYNDAYIDVLSLAKHPAALGMPAAKVWAEIWDICGPLANKVFQEGEASFWDEVRLFMNRGTFLEETYYSFSYSPIRDESGKVTGLFCPSTEVTPKVINARRLRTLAELSANALTQRTINSACSSAAATLAKNPDDIPFAALYVIDSDRNEARLAESYGFPKNQLELVNRNGSRLLRLVNTLLDFSRMEAGRMQATYQPTDLSAFTMELAGVFRSATERAGLKLELDCPPLPEPVYVDRNLWEKIVLNLMSNAFKFTFDGKISVQLKTAGKDVELRVSDTGVGIPAAELPHLFDRFHRVENSRSRTHEGSGIGLALVQELAKLHGGTVRVESTFGEGSTFTVSIPKGTAHLAPDRIEKERSASSTSLGANPFVEEAIRTRAPELVLTDVMMPRLDGFALLGELREDHATRTIPIIVLSARAGEESRLEGLQHGADDYLVKPFSARELLARVQTHLELARVRRESAEAVSLRTAQFETLFNEAPLGVYLVGSDFRIREINPQARTTFGDIPDLIGRDFGEVIHMLWPPSYADEIVRQFRHTLESGEPYSVAEHAEKRLDRDETEIYEWQINRISLPEGNFGVVCYFREISGQVRAREGLKENENRLRKLSETLDAEVRERTKELEERNADVVRQSQQVRTLSRRLLLAQDEERRHVARELHDSAGQTMSVLAMNLSQLVAHTANAAPHLAKQASATQELVRQLNQEIRTASYLLHPPLLDETGLTAAVSWYIDGLRERSGLDIQFSIPDSFPRLPQELELVIFRVLQECLTNIHRHSGSKTAAIRIDRDSDHVKIEVQDHGKGMSPERLAQIQSQGSGVGIRGMRERVRQFEGNVNIESGASGTRITVTIPVPPPVQESAATRAEPQAAV